MVLPRRAFTEIYTGIGAEGFSFTINQNIKTSETNIKKIVLFLFTSCVFTVGNAQSSIKLKADSAGQTISKYIYGHFAEHLGHLIYGGLYVGENNSSIANTNGVRNDIIAALKKLKVPVLRWPVGCFADTYLWKGGFGSWDKRIDILYIIRSDCLDVI